MRFSLAVLSAALLTAATSFAQAPGPSPGKPPDFPARVQVQIGTQQRGKEGSGYVKTMTISPKITLEDQSQMKGAPALQATMLIVTMDTAAKYKKRVENFKVHLRETKDVPASLGGQRRQIAFTETTVSYDSWRDSTNAGGAVYKYFVLGVQDPATKEFFDFQTNNPQLAAAVKAHPEKRAEILQLKKDAAFPAGF